MSGRGLSDLMVQLGEREWAVLEDLERFRLLTTRQIQRLHFDQHATSQASARATSRTLLRMRELALVTPLQRRVGGVRKGSSSFIWQLAARGDRLLRLQHRQPQRHRYVEPSWPFIRHTLAVADLAVGVTEAARVTPGLSLEELNTEPANWTTFLGPAGEARWLKPDLHVITGIHAQNDEEEPLEDHAFVEMDLGTEHRPRVVTKCRQYLDYAKTGHYQARHGLFPRVVWVSDDAARRRAIREAIETAEAISGLRHDVFHVTSTQSYLEVLTNGG